MKKTLYLMRHGQTLFNLEKRIQGWCDSPLTPLGIKQAQIARQHFLDLGITFDHAYSSTSERACDTLEIVTDHQMPYTRLKGLKELNYGTFEGKEEFAHPKLPFNDYFVAYGGESDASLRKRMIDTLTEIMEKDDHHSVLAVSHGAACGQFYFAFEDHAEVKREGRIYNCCIFQYEYENGLFILKDLWNKNITE